jgi:hypothetical protein
MSDSIFQKTMAYMAWSELGTVRRNDNHQKVPVHGGGNFFYLP